MPTKCKQPKQAIHADRNQEIQRPQTNANKTFSRQRFCVWRQTCFIMAPKTGSKKLVETCRPERDLDCTAPATKICTKRCQFSHRDCQKYCTCQANQTRRGDSKVSAKQRAFCKTEKRHLHPLLQLRFSTMRTWSKTNNLSG